MKSVGEVMAIGGTFAESFQKALRSMETGLTGLNEISEPDDWAATLGTPTAERPLYLAQAFRAGLSVEDIHGMSQIDRWFLRQIEDLVMAEGEIRGTGMPDNPAALSRMKQLGFSDSRLAQLWETDAASVRAARHKIGVRPVFKRVDTCAAEFESRTPYMYSTYESSGWADGSTESEAQSTNRRKIMVLGGGPNRIGQGIEFDYCCVHAAYALSEAGFETIMVNCNPETVSTDYDTSDRLYFEPLTAEDILEAVAVEKSAGELLGAIVQFGGQTPLNLARKLEAAGVPILGTTPDAIDLAEDRKQFQKLLNSLGLNQPVNGTATSLAEAEEIGNSVGYPVVIRPSYVLGGRAMEIVHDVEALRRYMMSAVKVSGSAPVLIDSYLRDAIELDVDALSDGHDVFVAGIMEHIEEAGIHSGDSACVLPPHTISAEMVIELRRQTEALARGLDVVGLMNVQFAVKGNDVYVLEVNPRASRTVPFVAKATGIPIAKIAARIMAGEKLADFNLPENHLSKKHVAVKEAVFPFDRFPGVDIILGPEMRSTGEVMGLDSTFEGAFAKSQLASGTVLPNEGVAFISVKDGDKTIIESPVKQLEDMGFSIVATRGTAEFLNAKGIEARSVNKVLEGSPHIVELIKSGGVQLVLNTTEGAQAIADSFSLRRAALVHHIPYYTTVAGARAAVGGIAKMREGTLEVAPLQSYSRTSH